MSPRHQSGKTKLLPPLSPLTYFRRNIWRVLPVGGAIIISVFLIAAIVTLLNSVDATIQQNYGSLRHFSVLAPQFDRDISPKILKKARTFPGIERVIVAMPYFVLIKTVFGEMPVPVYGMETQDMPRFVEATRNKLVAGRYPRVNQAEVLVSRLWANNWNVKVGDTFVPNSERLPSLADKQTIVGILDGGDYIALTDKTYLQLTLPEVAQRPSYLFLAKDNNAISDLAFNITQLKDNPTKFGFTKTDVQYLRVFTFSGLVGELRRSLAFLYFFLKIADILVIGTVAMLSGFLANIYFEQRLGEFGLLSALGFRRERLARRLIIETGSMVMLAWALGIGLTALMFHLLDLFYMAPRGLILAGINFDAFLYTFPIPIIVGCSSLATVLTRLYRLDPIEIMERR